MALQLTLLSPPSPPPHSLSSSSEEVIRLVLLEARQLQQEVDAIMSSVPGGAEFAAEAAERDPSLAAQLLSHHLAVQRNKRCLLVYHNHRMDWLKRKLWEKGGSVALVLEEEEEGGTGPTAGGGGGGAGGAAAASHKSHPVELRAKLSTGELSWLRNYASLLTAYKSEFLDILDIASPLSASSSSRARGRHRLEYKPPDELMVTVVAMRDAREVMTEMGTLNLRRGERMRVRRNEVEGLIVRGWLEIAED